MAAKPGRDTKRTVAVGNLGLAHEARAGGRAGGRARAELHAGFAREGNLRAEGSHVGGDGGHGVGVWANVSSSDRRVARCVRVTNLRARQGRRRLWRARPGDASSRLAGKGDGFSGRILQLDTRGFATAFQSILFSRANRKTCTRFSSALSSDGDFRRGFRPRTTVSLAVSSCDRASVFVSRVGWRDASAFPLFRLAKNRRARTFLAMTTAMENLATGVGPVKRERTEIVPVNNQGTSLPRKKFFRARAHCNPLSDSTFPVCVPSRRPSEPPPPPSNARVLPSRTRGRGGRALPRHLRTRARVARREFL